MHIGQRIAIPIADGGGWFVAFADEIQGSGKNTRAHKHRDRS